MTITIGDKTLATRRPSDLDDLLIAASGCNAAELASQLSAGGTGYHVARAVTPFLDKDAPAIGDLSAMIAADDVPRLRSEVVALLKPADAPAAAKTKSAE